MIIVYFYSAKGQITACFNRLDETLRNLYYTFGGLIFRFGILLSIFCFPGNTYDSTRDQEKCRRLISGKAKDIGKAHHDSDGV